jgi:hypothetical protein
MHRLGCFPVIENAMINSSFPYKRALLLFLAPPSNFFSPAAVDAANLAERKKVTPLGASVTVCHSSHGAIISWVEAWPLGWGAARPGVAIDSAPRNLVPPPEHNMCSACRTRPTRRFISWTFFRGRHKNCRARELDAFVAAGPE